MLHYFEVYNIVTQQLYMLYCAHHKYSYHLSAYSIIHSTTDYIPYTLPFILNCDDNIEFTL